VYVCKLGFTRPREFRLVTPLEINVPTLDQGRQALSALKGYRYQLYATALAWARLPPGSRLLVEVAEDYAVHADGALKAIQVKSEAKPVTLRSKGPLALLNAFWRLREANPSLNVHAAYLTTAIASKEQGSFLSDGETGIDHWRSCAREGVALGPLKSFLASLPLEPNFVSWLVNADDEDVRLNLLSRVSWECGASSISELDLLLSDAILTAGETRSLYLSDVEKVKDALLVQILAVASNSGPRELLYLHFISVMEAVCTAVLPLAALRRELSAPPPRATSGATPVALVPRATLTVPRPSVTTDLRAAIRQTGCAWLYGGTGLGKTSLALEIARRSNTVIQMSYAID